MLSDNTYQAPNTLWEVSERIEFDKPLDYDDERYVNTEKARGDFSFNQLYKRLGVDPKTLQLKIARQNHYILFCGHTGCGKSTELQRLSERLNHPQAYYVIFLDAVRQLDANNLEYSEIILALAQNLLQKLNDENIKINQVFITRLESWFKKRIESHQATKQFALEIKAGIKAKPGLPFLGALFASITNSFRTNSTYKEELRQIIKNSFSEFADAFNQLLVEVEAEIQKHQKGQKLLFVIDGTDRLKGDDRNRLFLDNVYQLKLLKGIFVYCAPIALIYQDNNINQAFDYVFKLPMIKISEKGEATPFDEAYKAMRQIIYLRADKKLFDNEETVNEIIKYSGGHPRDLLRLLNYAFDYAENDVFDIKSVKKAVKKLAEDYRRILEQEDYQLLHKIDSAPARETSNSQRIQHLLYNLALLEYNSYWWQSHPVIRTLPGYESLIVEFILSSNDKIKS